MMISILNQCGRCIYAGCRIATDERSCYLRSPIVSQHLAIAGRGRMDSILCKEDYLVTMVTVVVETSEHKDPITLCMKGEH